MIIRIRDLQEEARMNKEAEIDRAVWVPRSQLSVCICYKSIESENLYLDKHGQLKVGSLPNH